MKLKLKRLNFDAGTAISFIHEDAAKALDVHIGDRIGVYFNGKKTISAIDIARGFLKKDEISLSHEILSYLKAKPGVKIEISQTVEPASINAITKKMNGQSLSKNEISTIIKDIVNNALTEAEISYFILGVYEKGMSLQETFHLTEAMCDTGQILKWPSSYKVVDKHCIGGIPGNRTTPIVVSICSSFGIKMPKTSSRAITSAAGTADTIETLAKVDLNVSLLKKIVKKTGACLAWGGSLGLAPSDDKLIKVERMLNIDPESQLIASIMSKKLAAGSKYVLIDIPYGPGAKVSYIEAKKLKEKFIKVAEHFHVKVKVILTDGSQPIGNGIGPVLEMLDVLKVLKQDSPPKDLHDKSIELAGEILEMTGKAKSGNGKALALSALQSGKALKKFEQIITAQGRKKGTLKLAKYSRIIRSNASGRVVHIDNKLVNHLSRLLGCPVDKSSGIYLHKHKYAVIEKGAPIMTFYSESSKKMSEAIANFKSYPAVIIK